MTGLDTRIPDPQFDPDNYSQACRLGICDCAPRCFQCGKVKMWDEKRWPGHHDWHCSECHAYVTTPWKEMRKPVPSDISQAVRQDGTANTELAAEKEKP